MTKTVGFFRRIEKQLARGHKVYESKEKQNKIANETAILCSQNKSACFMLEEHV